jgi:predicted RNase H-like HicB family nuclease
MASLSTDIQGNVTKVQVEVMLVLDEDSGQYVAYCPALELSSYGDTEAEAQQAFEEALEFFASDTARRGTLDQLLLALGWRLTKKPAAIYEPPRFPMELLNQPARTRRMLTEEVLLPA